VFEDAAFYERRGGVATAGDLMKVYAKLHTGNGARLGRLEGGR
jgi:hypothetical protein